MSTGWHARSSVMTGENRGGFRAFCSEGGQLRVVRGRKIGFPGGKGGVVRKGLRGRRIRPTCGDMLGVYGDLVRGCGDNLGCCGGLMRGCGDILRGCGDLAEGCGDPMRRFGGLLEGRGDRVGWCGGRVGRFGGRGRCGGRLARRRSVGGSRAGCRSAGGVHFSPSAEENAVEGGLAGASRWCKSLPVGSESLQTYG